jgi:Holliday junction DNA helicase RuvA
MIGKLKGKLIEVENNIGLIETAGGLAYQVYLPPHLLSTLPLSSSVEIYTYLQVREDALILFGFETKKQSDFFKMLLTVPGVGPKTAFSIVSFSKIDELTVAIKENNADFFTRIPGLGKKTAMKIILELSQKLKSAFELQKMYLSEEDKTVVDALVSLGFKTHQAKTALSSLPKNLSVEEKIKKALMMIK